MAGNAKQPTNCQPTGFDFTLHMRKLCEDIAARHPAMRHVDMTRVAVSFRQTRKQVRHGLWASLTPMRFEGGALTVDRRGRRYTAQRYFAKSGCEYLYILNFYLPRFMQLSCRDKLVTVFHELWHISPNFDGDIRRHEGRCYAHTSSEKEYDSVMAVMVDEWLGGNPPEGLYTFLYRSFGQLQKEHGHVYGVKVPHPKLLPVRAM